MTEVSLFVFLVFGLFLTLLQNWRLWQNTNFNIYLSKTHMGMRWWNQNEAKQEKKNKQV